MNKHTIPLSQEACTSLQNLPQGCATIQIINGTEMQVTTRPARECDSSCGDCVLRVYHQSNVCPYFHLCTARHRTDNNSVYFANADWRKTSDTHNKDHTMPCSETSQSGYNNQTS